MTRGKARKQRWETLEYLKESGCPVSEWEIAFYLGYHNPDPIQRMLKRLWKNKRVIKIEVEHQDCGHTEHRYMYRQHGKHGAFDDGSFKVIEP